LSVCVDSAPVDDVRTRDDDRCPLHLSHDDKNGAGFSRFNQVPRHSKHSVVVTVLHQRNMSQFVTVDVIGKKRDKKELTTEEIKFVVDGFTSGAIADYQMSALLMAIVVIFN
jgi:hypothetical protein